MGKPCDRCGACDHAEIYEEEQTPVMCTEVHLAFGLISWLCYGCRKEYHRFAKNHPLNKKYGEALLRLEFWKARVGPGTPPTSIDEGLKLWREVEQLELKLNEVANRWLISDPDEVRAN
jgi:hypothetical protein